MGRTSKGGWRMMDPVDAACEVEAWRTVGRTLRAAAQPRDEVTVWFEQDSLAWQVFRPGLYFFDVHPAVEWQSAQTVAGGVSRDLFGEEQSCGMQLKRIVRSVAACIT